MKNTTTRSRFWLSVVGTGLITLFTLGSAFCAESLPTVTADQAMKYLADGNKRFVASKLAHPNHTAARRAEVAKGQSPFAIILTCSDSRTPPEVIFDRGLGDLFVVRNAGNVVDDIVLGSIEYAAEHLGVPVVMVLGHERCGAVKAAVAGGEVHGHVAEIIEELKPAVEAVKNQPGDQADNAARANVTNVVKELKESNPILKELVEKQKLKIVGAYYDLDTGRVALLP